MKNSRWALVSLLCPATFAVQATPPESRYAPGDLRKSGTVRMEISCDPQVRGDFEVAVALLHSFFYDEARRRFADIAQRDPQCAMAWWGVAMTWYHPLWVAPTAEEMAKGIEAVSKAKAIGGRTDLERGLIEAIDRFYRTEDAAAKADESFEQSCHGPRAYSARTLAFKDGLERLYAKYPANVEVAVFYALAVRATADPTDLSFGRQLESAAILEPLFERNPDHPGIAHYLIHDYDYPTLATRALQAARHYDDIAPWVSHALHMPTHIYTRLGMWKESIEGNVASAAAAHEYSARYYNGAADDDELHALDYLMYAYLQTGQDSKAKEIYGRVRGVRNIVPDNEFISAYAVGAIPARYPLECKNWHEAAAVEAGQVSFLARYPFAVAHVEFARGVGAARSGNVEQARHAVARLEELRTELTEPKYRWWTSQIEIQRLAAAGWLARAEGNDAEALRLLRESTELEGKAGAHPVTPGQILPAREQLADLLLELDQPAAALVEYERSLEAFPNRFNSYLGAAQAAERARKPEAARRHYTALLEMAGEGDGRRDALAVARKFMATAGEQTR